MTQKVREAMREAFAEWGRQGGKIGGKRRAERMTPAERSEAARKASRARWARSKKGRESDDLQEPVPAPPAEEPLDRSK